MAKRRGQDETAFGSDSFLDVVANVVGILIILMVIAGLKVSRSPVQLPPESAPEAAAVAPEPAPEPPPVAAVVVPPEKPEPVQEVVAIPVAPEPPAAPPVELVARAAELRAHLVGLTSDLDQARQRQADVVRQSDEARSRLAGIRQSLNADEQARSAAEQRAAEARELLRSAQRELAQRQDALRGEAAAAASAETDVVMHRVTPISREVTGSEVHFRLAGGRVSVAPLDALANELKLRIERNRDTLLRLSRYDGSIGPVDGYKMHYVIERQPVSVIDELRYGQQIIRMGLSFYELEPLPEMVTESAEEALRSGSRFRRELDRAGTDATVTFWVYPDSFELHRALLDHVHSAGFDAAVRPLPMGVPIAGSPHGSKSMAQ